MYAIPIEMAVMTVINASSASIRSGSASLELTSAPVWRCVGGTGTRTCGVRVDRLHLDGGTGLRAGDLIVRVNGMPVGTPDAVLAAVRTLARAGRADLDVARDGRLVVLRQAQLGPLVHLIASQPRPPAPPAPPRG